MGFKKSDGAACASGIGAGCLREGIALQFIWSITAKKAAADSILQLLALGAKEGSELVLSADGEGDKHSVEKLEAFLAILEG